MYKLIRERFPKLKVVIGVWGFSGDSEKAKARFERTRPDRLLTSLAQAVEQIQELIRPRPRHLCFDNMPLTLKTATRRHSEARPSRRQRMDVRSWKGQ